MSSATGDHKTGASSQATARVVDVLELLASGPLSLAEVAEGLAVHRSVAYRVLRTLAERKLVDHRHGNYQLGELLLVLANAVPNELRDVSVNELTRISEKYAVTAFISIQDGTRSVCFQTVEPTVLTPHVTLRPGTWGPMTVGAPAIAMLAGRDPVPDEPEEVQVARACGYATSDGNRPPGVQWVAAPIRRGLRPAEAAIGVLYPVGAHDVVDVGVTLADSGLRIARSLTRTSS